jgi:hypothetical protein
MKNVCCYLVRVRLLAIFLLLQPLCLWLALGDIVVARENLDLPMDFPSTEGEPIIEPVEVTDQPVISLEDKLEQFDKIAAALPRVKGLGDVSDAELDSLANKAEQAYDDLMDLGMNVEVRYASRIFEVASSMMNNAISAKTAKIDKKLKAIDIQMKKYKIDKDNNEDPNDVINGQGYIITDRNELLKKLGQKD